MSATLLKAQPLKEKMMLDLKQQVESIKTNFNQTPHLSVIIVGDDKASHIYVKHKQKSCHEVGISTSSHILPSETSEEILLELICQLNTDDTVHGILVQLPLPAHISSQKVIDTISPLKDVDGFHPFNVGHLALRSPLLRPCTPYGIIKLLKYYDIPLLGQDVTIVGVSNIVGRPLSLEFLLAKATPTTCHRFTKDLESHVRRANIVVSATGVRDVIKPEWVNENAIVIDVGIHRLDNGKLCGDLDFDALKDKVSHMTPVPGGVGPMTVAVLLENTLKAFHYQNNSKN